MSAHDTCHRVGKFDCEHDEVVSEFADLAGDNDGDVDAPSGWWSTITLVPSSEMPDPEYGDDDERIEHYGSRYLIAREDQQGFFKVIAFDTTEEREDYRQALADDYSAWRRA